MSRPIVADINLGALRRNFQRLQQAAPASRVIAVVKANAYGHGLVPVAQALSSADMLAVACIEEAQVLRQGGIEKTVLLLEGVFTADELPLCCESNFEIAVHHESQLDMLDSVTLETPLNVWLKIDTGMHRLGFLPERVQTAWKRLQASANVGNIRYMTHFADADQRSNSHTNEQLDVLHRITSVNNNKFSAANSAATLAWPDSHSDCVRAGIALYGASPFEDSSAKEQNLEPVMTLRSALISVKRLKQGDPVGYASKYVCPEDMDVGAVAAGYGDGYSRHIPCGTPMLLNGKTVPLIGRVSMDMITLDLRTAPAARVGDPVVLWGEGLSVESIAAAADTISYTLLCGITGRVRMHYGHDN